LKRHSIAAIALLLNLIFTDPASARSETFEIDPSHSAIGFAVKHMVISTVHGKFSSFSGEIVLNEEEDLTRSSVVIAIQASSIDTGLLKRDYDLRGPSFFDVTKFPQITFSSSRIEKSGDHHFLIGPLTMHGVTKEVKFPFSYNGKVTDTTGCTRLGAEASLVINRQDWGISYNKILDSGSLVAANDVYIQLDIEAKKK
jgi:polyisoprenoid-binding protein YceI